MKTTKAIYNRTSTKLKTTLTIHNRTSTKLKTIVAIPPLRDFYFTSHRFSGLGAKSLVRILQNQGIDVTYINLPLFNKKGTQIPIPHALSYLSPYLIPGETGKISFFTKYQHFGPDLKESARIICSHNPDFVCLSCFAFCYADQTIELAKEIKQTAPTLPVIAGGPGVSVYPEYFLQKNDIDYVLTGDAERAVPSFIKTFSKKEIHLYKTTIGSNEVAIHHSGTTIGSNAVANLYWKENGCINHFNIKPGKVDILFTWSITSETKQMIHISTSLTRGCTKKCRFCTHWADNQMYTVPEQSIIQGIREIKRETGKKGKEVSIIFEDDNILLEPHFFINTLKNFQKELGSFSFFIETGVDYTLLTINLLEKLINLGLIRINISLASINRELLQSEKRSLDLSLYENQISLLQKKRIPSVTYFICGFKNETKETVAQNLAYIAKKPTRCGISLFYPVPGLPGFRDLSLFNRLSPCLCAGSSAYPWNNSLSTQTLIILNRSKDPFAEQTVSFGFVGTIIYCFRLQNFTARAL